MCTKYPFNSLPCLETGINKYQPWQEDSKISVIFAATDFYKY
ncbi:hypothetical protein HMPREF2531_05009 [Bacteroides intestinalis]|uniref:Uncharacterized protein n=1 Tax=Bacteroides intestinalis TaxID=329854 RepID=A0A139KPU4_9BACE|nr:hypothetical protein HMPREF2531_05009 [Bacteroides intestinalis]